MNNNADLHHQRQDKAGESSSSSFPPQQEAPTSTIHTSAAEDSEEIGKVSIQSAVECAERLRTAGHYDQAIDILERAYQYATTMVNPTNRITIPTLHILWQIGRTYHVASNLETAMAIFERVLLQAQQLSQHDIVADCLFRLAHMKQYTGEVRSAETYYGDALHVAIVIHGTKHHMDVATILYNLGLLAHGQSNLFVAQGLYEEAIRIASAIPRPASLSSLSPVVTNPNKEFIANALDLIIQIVEQTTGIGSNEDGEVLLNAITHREPSADDNTTLWEMLANFHLVANMCEIHAKVDDAFCAAAA